jgi:hypothetical protein
MRHGIAHSSMLPAIGKGIRRHVDNAHDEGAVGEIEKP